mgnify:FL=1
MKFSKAYPCFRPLYIEPMISNNGFNDGDCDDPVSAAEYVARLRLELRAYSLEQLEDLGLVESDKECNVVYKGPYFADKFPPE